MKTYLSNVVPTVWLIGVGAADQVSPRTGLEEDPDVVLAVLLRLALQQAQLGVGLRRVPKQIGVPPFGQIVDGQVVDFVPASQQYGRVVLMQDNEVVGGIVGTNEAVNTLQLLIAIL